MKTNRFAVYMLLIMIFSLFLVAYAPMSAIELPQELVEVLGFVVMLGFTALAKWVAGKLGFDIKDKAAEIASAVAAMAVIALNHYLALLPIEYESWIQALFAFLTVLFGGNGVYALLFRDKEQRKIMR